MQLRTTSLKFIRSIWFFPAVLTCGLLGLTALGITGSSIGVYNTYFNGQGVNDPAHIRGNPRSLRSDEWIVQTQMTIAQSNNNFERVNPNIGDSQDMSVIIDAPYKDWSEAFKPHNWAFFVLPFDNAFAFKWWFMAYLLALAAYFFVLALLPGKHLLAALLALGLFCSPFVQWWYQFITLAPIYYGLFAATLCVYILRAKNPATKAWLGIGLAYVTACFAMVAYPPFQIPAALAVAAFVLGYTLTTPRKVRWPGLAIMAGALCVAGAVTAAFLVTRIDVVHAYTDSVYPGHRVVTSGGADIAHIFSSHLAPLFQGNSRGNSYNIFNGVQVNQSESSNFILITLLLLPVTLTLLYKDARKRRADWSLVFTTAMMGALLVWLTVPNIEFLGRILLLNIVPPMRVLIGLGILNFVQLVLLVRRRQDIKLLFAKQKWVIAYACGVFTLQVILGLIAWHRSPGFINPYEVVALAVPISATVYVFLRGHMMWATVGLLVFSVASVMFVNPFYRGTNFVTHTPLSSAIQTLSATHKDSVWAIEPDYLENFALLNGAKSLSGVYAYPQLQLWRDIQGQVDTYNRYAHVQVQIDRDPNQTVATHLQLITGDHFVVVTEPCSDFLQRRHVGFILTKSPIDDPCVQLVQAVSYPAKTFYIYTAAKAQTP